ncbi:hypothetical protein HRbin33_00088 [bacterium HR33]|nr:hypothetical protein HRbin33_00088 [bacterium HR33]
MNPPLLRLGLRPLAAAALLGASLWEPAAAQRDSSASDTAISQVERARPGAEFRIPLASLLAPGVGQYIYGAPLMGATLTGTAALGAGLYLSGDQAVLEQDLLPRHLEGQQSVTGALLVALAGYYSAYDAFSRGLPGLQAEGKYSFISRRAPLSQVLSAPFDPSFLKRWTTWLDLAYTAGIVTLLTASRTEPDKQYLPFKWHDGAFVAAIGYMPGTGEEAFFRGWLYPVLYQRFGQKFWLANSVQAAIFGSLHLPQAGTFAAAIAAWAWYEGWLTRRNGWNIRESVFHHFWYNVAVSLADFLTEQRPQVAIQLPPIPLPE